MRQRGEFAGALVLLVAGAALALLFASFTWETLSVSREAPLGNLVLHVSGRQVDAAPTALALVALAGVVAVLATRGIWRRGIGVIVALDGLALIWRAATASLSTDRAWAIIVEKLPSVGPANDSFGSSGSSGAWSAVTAACGVLVLLAGVTTAWRGAAWAGMSARYSRTPDPIEDAAAAQAKANASLWNSLEHGDDPTAR
ncbi:MAG TPA: Trp biosynthesis-associated membrane protein [Jatrophihabitans sp.]|jgi:uncharacterized membrane protein (TIGR02234 family)